jgi:uncharacterized protein (TIGR00369 family)
MPGFEPVDPDFAQRVRASFAKQGLMAHLGVELAAIEPGVCRLEVPYRPALTQQHGFFHAGVTTSLADSAAGYAAFSLMPADAAVLTVELKINLMAPAKGERLIATGQVEKAGRTLMVVRSEVVARAEGATTTVAVMLGTMMCLRGASIVG